MPFKKKLKTSIYLPSYPYVTWLLYIFTQSLDSFPLDFTKIQYIHYINHNKLCYWFWEENTVNNIVK